MTASAIILVIAAYFWGAIPVAHLVVKALRGVDLRDHGSGSVGSSNAAHVVGRRIAVATGVVEVLKGATPIWVAQALDLEIGQQMAAGVACIVGHNWSVWMRFKGGRGMSILFGVMLAVARLELLLFTIVGLFGIAFWGSVPLFLGLSAALLPMWSWLLERSEAYILGLGLMVLVVVLKRLLGNELPEKWSERIIFYRLFFDRDVRDRDEWVRRGIKTKPARDDSSPRPPPRRRSPSPRPPAPPPLRPPAPPPPLRPPAPPPPLRPPAPPPPLRPPAPPPPPPFPPAPPPPPPPPPRPPAPPPSPPYPAPYPPEDPRRRPS